MALKLLDVASNVSEFYVDAWCKLNGFNFRGVSKTMGNHSTFDNFISKNNPDASLTLSVENVDKDGKNILCFQLCHDSEGFGAVAIITVFVGNSVEIDIDEQTSGLDIDTTLPISEQMKRGLEVFLLLADSTKGTVTKGIGLYIEKERGVVGKVLCHVSKLEYMLKQANN